jgi:hypothetical protein
LSAGTGLFGDSSPENGAALQATRLPRKPF